MDILHISSLDSPLMLVDQYEGIVLVNAIHGFVTIC